MVRKRDVTLREEEEQTVPRRGRSCHGTVEGTEDASDTDRHITDNNTGRVY